MRLLPREQVGRFTTPLTPGQAHPLVRRYTGSATSGARTPIESDRSGRTDCESATRVHPRWQAYRGGVDGSGKEDAGEAACAGWVWVRVGLTVDGVPEGIHDIQVEGTFPVSRYLAHANVRTGEPFYKSSLMTAHSS